jgi:4-hydroxy-3-polyprenylbenzoate decarboxylase
MRPAAAPTDDGRPHGCGQVAGVTSTATPASVFVGVSGASGAPYAARLLQALEGAGCTLHLCVSDTGVLVLQHELELPAGGRDVVVPAFLAMTGVTAEVYEPDDLAAPASSGSSSPDAVVVCPCSVGTAAHIALGTTRTLIHRAADVALKERRQLVVVPRETPLTQIHLRRLLELAEAGAVVLPAMPAFYSRPRSLQEAVDQVIGKVLSALGLPHALFPPWDGGAR